MKYPLFNEIQIEKNFSNCIFSSQSSIALVNKYTEPHERFFVMDGTFRITPHGIFNQVLVIYVRFGLKVCTIIFIMKMYECVRSSSTTGYFSVILYTLVI